MPQAPPPQQQLPADSFIELEVLPEADPTVTMGADISFLYFVEPH